MIENLRSLAVLVAVVEEGSFRNAGQRLGLSPSVISHHISNLEDRLKCELLNRSSRSLALTERGAVLFQAAREMVNAAEGGLTAITAPDNGVATGTLRVSAAAVLSAGAFGGDIEEFLRQNPKIKLDLSFTKDQVHPINDKMDVVISTTKYSDPLIECQPITGRGAGFYAAPDLADRLEGVAHEDILRKIPLLLSIGFTRAHWSNLFSNELPVDPNSLNFRVKSDDLNQIHSFCRSGLGLAVLPHTLVAEDVERGLLIPVLKDMTVPEIQFFLLWARKSRNAPLVSRFVEHIKTRFGGA